jgi:hypothetical protein
MRSHNGERKKMVFLFIVAQYVYEVILFQFPKKNIYFPFFVFSLSFSRSFLLLSSHTYLIKKMVDSLKVMNRRSRPHSNTISGSRPPALDIPITRPSIFRRNSEGSPGLPPPICISEPTPIEPSVHNGFFEDKTSTTPSSANSSRPTTPNSDNSTPPAPVPLPKSSATAPVGTMLDSPTTKRKSRSRGSSITSNLINEIRESSTLQKVASKIKSSRYSSEDADGERNSFDGGNSAPPSVAGTSGVYLANAKRNQDFHALFRSVPEEDSLIEGKNSNSLTFFSLDISN